MDLIGISRQEGNRVLGDQREEETKLVTVYTAFGQLEAHVIKSKLESAGIPVLLSYESAGPVLGLTVDGLGQVRIMVPEDMALEAREMLY